MKTVRFSKVVEKSGRPEIYLLMSETDPVFRKALDADKMMSLSSENHGAGTESGTVGYDRKRHGQLLLFPKSLKAFTGFKVVGIKYDLLAESNGDGDDKAVSEKAKTKKAGKRVDSKSPLPMAKKAKPKKESKAPVKKVIPFVTGKEEVAHEEDGDHLKAFVRQAMRALEKGNSVAAYNLLKRIIPDP